MAQTLSNGELSAAAEGQFDVLNEMQDGSYYEFPADLP